MTHRFLLMMVVASALTTAASAFAPPFMRITSAEKTLNQPGSRWANTNGEVHGRLAYLRLDLVCEETTPRAARLAADSTEERGRQTPREIAANLMESIVTTITPDAWHPQMPSEIEDGLAPSIDPRDPTNGFNLDARARHPGTRSLLPLKVTGKWASIVYKDKTLIVRGPAFVHLGIAGLPRPVPPPSSIVDATSR